MHHPQLHDKYLSDLHQSHASIETVQHSTCTALPWPRIDAEFSNYMKRCPTCIQHKPFQTTLPMLNRDIPDAPGGKLPQMFSPLKGMNTYLSVPHLAYTLSSLKYKRRQQKSQKISCSKSSVRMDPLSYFTQTMESHLQQKPSHPTHNTMCATLYLMPLLPAM